MDKTPGPEKAKVLGPAGLSLYSDLAIGRLGLAHVLPGALTLLPLPSIQCLSYSNLRCSDFYDGDDFLDAADHASYEELHRDDNIIGPYSYVTADGTEAAAASFVAPQAYASDVSAIAVKQPTVNQNDLTLNLDHAFVYSGSQGARSKSSNTKDGTGRGSYTIPATDGSPIKNKKISL